MMQTAEQERDWWQAAGPENIWGLPDEDNGVTVCVEQIDPILHGLGAGSCVLDLGCGPGRLLPALAKRHPLTTFAGMDIRFYDHSGINERNIGWMVGDGRTILYADGMLDAVYSVAMLQHLEHDTTRGYLAEIARCLKPGGKARLQHVLGVDDCFLSHQLASDDLLANWCEEAGLTVEAVDVGAVHDLYVWVTASRP